MKLPVFAAREDFAIGLFILGLAAGAVGLLVGVVWLVLRW